MGWDVNKSDHLFGWTQTHKITMYGSPLKPRVGWNSFPKFQATIEIVEDLPIPQTHLIIFISVHVCVNHASLYIYLTRSL